MGVQSWGPFLCSHEAYIFSLWDGIGLFPGEPVFAAMDVGPAFICTVGYEIPIDGSKKNKSIKGVELKDGLPVDSIEASVHVVVTAARTLCKK